VTVTSRAGSCARLGRAGRQPPLLTTASRLTLIAIGLAILLVWALTAWLFAVWYHRRKLRRRYA